MYTLHTLVGVTDDHTGRNMSRRMTKPTKWHVRPAKTDQPGHPPSLISLRCPNEESLDPYLPIEHTAKTLITLGGNPG